MDSSDPGNKLTSADADRLLATGGYWGDTSEIDAREERPFGVSLVVVFIVLGAILNAFFALNAWIRAEELEEAPLLAIVFIAQMVLGFVVAFGLWGLREWGRIIAVILYSLSFLFSFIRNFNEPLTAGSLMGLVIPAAIALYLIQPGVKDKFI
jgi:hypothetical protein